MKMPIAWHIECLENWKDSLLREEADMDRARARVDLTKSMIAFYEEQIAEAKKKGKDGFDSDKFMRKTGHDA